MRSSLMTLAVAAVATVAVATPAVAAAPHTHIAGPDRYETAVQLSQGIPAQTDHRTYSTCTTAYLVSGASFPDAVSASGNAVRDGGRVLLIEENRIPDTTWAEIRRLHTANNNCLKLDVIGGWGTISQSVWDELDAYNLELDRQGKGGNFSITGTRGSDRYSSNLLSVIGQIINSDDPYPTAAFIATGENYPDALAAAPYTKSQNAALLLTPKTQLPEFTAEELARDGSDAFTGINTFYILGGQNTVSENVVNQIKALRPGATVERIAGNSRYETSALLAQRFGAGRSTAVVATGNNFPDALAAAPFAAHHNGVVLLSNGNNPTAEVRDQLNRGGYGQVTTVGAANAAAIS